MIRENRKLSRIWYNSRNPADKISVCVIKLFPMECCKKKKVLKNYKISL